MEFRLWLISADATTHTVPTTPTIKANTLESALAAFAKRYNLTLDSIEDNGRYAWFVHRLDGSAFRYSIHAYD